LSSRTDDTTTTFVNSSFFVFSTPEEDPVLPEPEDPVLPGFERTGDGGKEGEEGDAPIVFFSFFFVRWGRGRSREWDTADEGEKLDSQRTQRATGSDAHGVKDGTVREEGGRGDW